MNQKNPNILNWKSVKKKEIVLLKTDKKLYKWSILSTPIYKLMVSPKWYSEGYQIVQHLFRLYVDWK